MFRDLARLARTTSTYLGAVGEQVGHTYAVSVELHVFLDDQALPGRDDWQSSLEANGFATVLDPEFDPSSDTGFRPVRYDNVDTGFEFWLEPAAPIAMAYPEIAERVGHLSCATFSWGGDIIQLCAAFSAAACLTELSGGVLFDPQEGSIISADEVIGMAREVLASI
jgi:hypothetical protein